MEITLTIDEKQVPFKSTGAVPKRYMMQFGRDFLKDIIKMGVQEADFEKMTQAEMFEWIRGNIDFDMFYDIAWTFAKTANPQIPDPLTWLDSFDVFPIMELVEELKDLITQTISSKKK